MRSYLVIGLGRYGRHLALGLMKIPGNEVMVIDHSEELVSDIASEVTKAQIGDGRKPELLKAVGVGSFDVCFVCTGSNFQSSLEITALLKELGAKRVISKAGTAIQEKFLLRNGADEVVYPERDAAEKLARRFSMNSILDFLEVTDDVSIFEIECAKAWAGQSIADLRFRSIYNLNILAIKKDNIITIPDALYTFDIKDRLMVLGRNADMEKLLRKLK